MFRRAEPVVATAEEREVLESWVKGAKTEQRLALRGRIILAAAAVSVAAMLGTPLIISADTALAAPDCPSHLCPQPFTCVVIRV